MARVLVAEADPQARRFLSSVLEFGGHRVVEAATGDAAVAAIGRERIEVTVTELRLPGLTGADLVRVASRVDEHLCCLVLGGSGDLAAIDEALEAGAIGIILKPTTPRHVLCCVARAHERRLYAHEAVRARLLGDLVAACATAGGPPWPVASLTLRGVVAVRGGAARPA
jgi:DNA-binding NtrC family response regulator